MNPHELASLLGLKPYDLRVFTYKIPQVIACSHPFFGRDTTVTSM
jgi:hypothetical protein